MSWREPPASLSGRSRPASTGPVTRSMSSAVLTVSSRYSIRKAAPTASIAPIMAASRVLVTVRGRTGDSGTMAGSATTRLLVACASASLACCAFASRLE